MQYGKMPIFRQWCFLGNNVGILLAFGKDVKWGPRAGLDFALPENKMSRMMS